MAAAESMSERSQGHLDHHLAVDAFSGSAAKILRPARCRYSCRYIPSGGIRCGDYRDVADLWSPAAGAVVDVTPFEPSILVTQLV